MRKYFFEVLTILLYGGSMVFFYECVRFLAKRDYVASLVLMFVGLAVIRAGSELARLAMIERQ
ncbi:MAG: hypothetical protein KC503_36055 [Myxococcales bacterium]|nr:hypothetical protein [Myxococcales bacterium]